MDTAAWIEYFGETPLGRRLARNIIDADAVIITPAVVITEFEGRAIKAGKDVGAQIEFIRTRGSVAPITLRTARSAAGHRARHELYTVDALVYACAQETGAVLLTEDEKLLNLKGVKSLRQL